MAARNKLVDTIDAIDAANAHAANPQNQLQGLTVNPTVLPVGWKARAKGLTSVTAPEMETITKELLKDAGDLYIVGAKLIENGQYGECYLFKFRTARFDGVHNSFFGKGIEQRDDIYRAFVDDPSTIIGPLRIEERVTKGRFTVQIFVESTVSDAVQLPYDAEAALLDEAF